VEETGLGACHGLEGFPWAVLTAAAWAAGGCKECLQNGSDGEVRVRRRGMTGCWKLARLLEGGLWWRLALGWPCSCRAQRAGGVRVAPLDMWDSESP
jgi:hypothetical protein